MAHIIPEVKDFSTKEGVENYINATTIDFNQLDGSSLYAYLYGEAFHNGVDGTVVENMYKRSCDYSDGCVDVWDNQKVYDRLMPLVYDVANIIGVNVNADDINAIVKELERSEGKDLSEIISKEMADNVIYIYNHMTLSDLQKIYSDNEEEIFENVDKLYEDKTSGGNNFPYEDFKPKYNKRVNLFKKLFA